MLHFRPQSICLSEAAKVLSPRHDVEKFRQVSIFILARNFSANFRIFRPMTPKSFAAQHYVCLMCGRKRDLTYSVLLHHASQP